MGTPVDTSGWRLKTFIFIFIFLSALVTINYFMVDANSSGFGDYSKVNQSGVPKVDAIGKITGALSFSYIDNVYLQWFMSIVLWLCIFTEGLLAYSYIKEWF